MGIIGCVRVHRGRVFPLAGQEAHVRPELQLLLVPEHTQTRSSPQVGYIIISYGTILKASKIRIIFNVKHQSYMPHDIKQKDQSVHILEKVEQFLLQPKQSLLFNLHVCQQFRKFH
ncbi:serine hydroxymethyltransferase [Striga asiatica]|uniref:Serine hydroxymethyltransferase n=1 Tax=Striga asiatica TaxID=4170 RepID=A0A5A7R1V8_STRAF|nr:serine hydroxymethyltransferase [Striga asiatica]